MTEFAAALPSGDGYTRDPGYKGGTCKGIPSQKVHVVGHEFAESNWVKHPAYFVYLPPPPVKMQYQKLMGLPNNYNSLFSAQFAHCDLKTCVAALPAGGGYTWDPAYNGGTCMRRLSAGIV